MAPSPVEGLVDVLFIQGGGPGAHDADRALADALSQALGAGFRIHFPRMPGEDDPDNAAWKRTIAAEARRANAAFLVAHSVAASLTADMLAQGPHGADLPRLRGLFLLAPPFIGPGGWAFEGFHFDRPVDRKSLDGLPIHFYFGASDTTVPLAHADLYADIFPGVAVHRLQECDHQFTGHMPRVAQDILALKIR
jgi:predicted alpha/beta hydrolase family esterase